MTSGKMCCWIFVVVVMIVIDSRLNYDNENDLDTKTPNNIISTQSSLFEAAGQEF